MENFVIAGKAKTVFKLIKLMAEGEQSKKKQIKRQPKINPNFNPN